MMKNSYPAHITDIQKIILYFLICFLISGANVFAQPWLAYSNPEEAGFSEEALQEVTQIYDTSGASALLVVADGHIVLSLGDNTRRFMIHSIRKSFMSAMIGREIARGTVSTDLTLDEIEIDDRGQLTEIEKSATVGDLLKARSGIYLPAAYSPQSMIDNLPERGSAVPGKKWYYNNWDFNTLAAIYNLRSGKDFFEAFHSEVAAPIGMEDFRMDDVYYRYEKDKSDHPAYLFNMSGRDLARFGQLYLNQGNWNGQQIVPEEWANISTSRISTDLGRFSSREAYGLLWWVSSTHTGSAMYYASGSGGHRIIVLPEDKMVLVFRVNTYENRSIDAGAMAQMIKSIIDARVGEPVARPGLLMYQPACEVLEDTFEGSMDRYLGRYRHRFLGEMEIMKEENAYYLENNIGRFRLFAVAEDQFYPEDLRVPLKMTVASKDREKGTIETLFNRDRSMREVVFYY